MTAERNTKPIEAGIPSAPLWAYAVRFGGKVHQKNLARLMEFKPLMMARMDAIDEGLLEEYVKWRSSQHDDSWLKINREL